MRWPLALVVALLAWGWIDLLIGRPPGWPEGFGFVAGLLLLAWASADLRSQGFAPALWRGRPGGRRVALTFDDGPHPVGTPRALDALALHGVRATFFFVAERAATQRQLVERVVREGHQVELHGWDHRWQQWLTPRRARAALQRGVRMLEEVTGRRPGWLRPPFGVLLPALGGELERSGLRLVGWSRRARDGGGGGDAQRMLERLQAGLRDGDILLLHDGPHREGGDVPRGPELIEPVLGVLREAGLAPVTLNELVDEADA